MERPLGFGLLGCGRIASRHAELLCHEVPGAKLVAVCDVIPERAEKLASSYDVPFFTDPTKFLQHEGIDVVNILTPNGSHARDALLAAKAKKHVVVEKPMALCLEDAEAMIVGCARERVQLFVVKQNRFNRPILALRKALEAGRFGKLIHGSVRVRWCRTQEYYDHDAWRGTWELDGGVFNNQGSHAIDMLTWMMGDVESVIARTAKHLARIETEDTGVAVLRFHNGASGAIEVTTATRPRDLEGSLTIMGERGVVEIAGFAMNEIRSWAFDQPQPEDDELLSRCRENPPNVYGYGHREYLRNVIDSIAGGAQAIVDGVEGMKSIILINALYESANTGREVRLRFQMRKNSARAHS